MGFPKPYCPNITIPNMMAFTAIEYEIAPSYLKYLRDNRFKKVVLYDYHGGAREFRLTRKGTLKKVK
jgi:predicted transcriptional regulator